jgi:hypothetical protein
MIIENLIFINDVMEIELLVKYLKKNNIWLILLFDILNNKIYYMSAIPDVLSKQGFSKN